MGVPAPLTVDTIMDIQVPRNITPPKTNGCSGFLQTRWNENIFQCDKYFSIVCTLLFEDVLVVPVAV